MPSRRVRVVKSAVSVNTIARFRVRVGQLRQSSSARRAGAVRARLRR